MVDTKWGGWVVWAPADESPILAKNSGVQAISPQCIRSPVNWACSSAVHAPTPKPAPRPFVEQVRRGLKTVNPRLDRALTAVCRGPRPVFLVADRLPVAGLDNGRTRCCSATLRPDSCRPRESVRAWRWNPRGCSAGCWRTPTARGSPGAARLRTRSTAPGRGRAGQFAPARAPDVPPEPAPGGGSRAGTCG